MKPSRASYSYWRNRMAKGRASFGLKQMRELYNQCALGQAKPKREPTYYLKFGVTQTLLDRLVRYSDAKHPKRKGGKKFKALLSIIVLLENAIAAKVKP